MLSDDAQHALDAITTERSFDRNAIIQEIGTSCRTVYIVRSGAARIFYLKDGTDITEHFAFENELIVRAESLFTGLPTRKGIQAIDHTVLAAIDSRKLFELFDIHHDVERLFRHLIEREYVNTVKRIENLQFMSARERYIELLENTDYVKRIPLKFIASYLGITQVSLSRIRAELT